MVRMRLSVSLFCEESIPEEWRKYLHAWSFFCIAEACKEALPGLARIVADPESRSEANITATENAISAVAKIIKFCPSCANLDEVIPLW